MRTNDLRWWLIALSWSANFAPPAWAADEAVTPESAPSGLEEITVTARKRQESLFDVPVVAVVVGGIALDQSEITDLPTLATRVPGLVVSGGPSVTGPSVSIRGVGTTVVNATSDQSVSLNVDGLQLSQAYAYSAAVFDLSQAEILKGPQALFFGKNSPAGVISLRSADPTDQVEEIVRGGYEAVAQGKLGELILSGPVTDTLKLRLAAHYSDDNGFFKNLDTAPEGFGVRSPTTNQFAPDQNVVLRGTALFKPSDLYDARLKVNYVYDYLNDGGGDQITYCPGGTAGLVSFTGLPVFDPHEDCTLNRNLYTSWADPAAFPYLSHDGIPYARSTSEFGTLEQNAHLGQFVATSVTGFYVYDRRTVEAGTDAGGIDPFFADNAFSNRQFTEEVRLTSNFQGPLNFMAGGFYQNGHERNHVRINGDTALELPAILQDVVHDVNINSISGFGQVIWNATDKIELAGGARETHESRGHTEDNFSLVSGPLGPTATLQPQVSSTNTSPEATLTYKPNEDLRLFASYKEGFKSGSFNTVQYYSATTPSSFGDESVKSGEVGLKSRLLDRRLSLNLAAYYSQYTGLQVGAIETTSAGAFALQTVNAASANVKGIDFDASYAPASVEGLTLTNAINYNHARYASFFNAPCGGNQTIAQGCNQQYDASAGAYTAQNLTGQPLTRAPEWMVTAGVDYELRLGQAMTLGAGGSLIYVSSFYTDILDAPQYVQSAYVKANLNVALKGANDAWEVALIGNNINDKITASNCANANLNGALIFGGQQAGKATGGVAGPDYTTCNGDRGREVWLRVTVRPGAFLHH